MKSILISLALILLTLIYNYGQEGDALSRIDLSDISGIAEGSSYITFPADIGNIEPLWFEGNFLPNFNIRKSKDSRFIGVLTPQIIIRMYQERSYPVRTPSYVPRITLYHLLTENDKGNKLLWFGRYAHHSNGQDGEFFDETGEINTLNGDFSTNFAETGLLLSNYNISLSAHQFIRSSIEIHPKSWNANEMNGIYARYRWNNQFMIYKIPSQEIHDHNGKKAEMSVRGEINWLFGEMNEIKSLSTKRLNLSLTYFYHPEFLEELGLFVQFYHGSDYYNIYFSHCLDILRFGIMTDKLRF